MPLGLHRQQPPVLRGRASAQSVGLSGARLRVNSRQTSATSPASSGSQGFRVSGRQGVSRGRSTTARPSRLHSPSRLRAPTPRPTSLRSARPARSATPRTSQVARPASLAKGSKCHSVEHPKQPLSRPAERELPPSLRTRLDAWGPQLRTKVLAACAAWMSKSGKGRSGVGVKLPTQDQLHVGTDCSGAEAPIWSLRSMNMPHTHVFSCDVSENVRKFVRACSQPVGPIYEDMLRRDVESLPAHSLYLCGFPCTPFSTLRGHSTRLMREPAAKPFFCAVKTIGRCLPAIAVLENVLGIDKVLKRVLTYFEKLLWYHVLVMPIDSASLGQPVSRPRYYFILVRRDVCLLTAPELADLAKALHTASCTVPSDNITARMLPDSSPEVKALRANACAVRQNDNRKAKWEMHHDAFARQHGVRRCLGVRVEGLSAKRAQEAFSLLSQVHRGGNMIADVSQNVHRAPVTTSGVSPTVTPHGLVVVQQLNRIMLPIEKLLVHNFPVHRMKVPSSIADPVLASLGGNTMHLASVGLAMLIAISAVDWANPASGPGKKPSGATPAREQAIVIKHGRGQKRPHQLEDGKASKKRAALAKGSLGVRASGR